MGGVLPPLKGILLNWKFYLAYYAFLAVGGYFALQWAFSLPVVVAGNATSGKYGSATYSVMWRNMTVDYAISTEGDSCVITIPSRGFQWLSVLGDSSPSRFNASNLALALGTVQDPICKAALGDVHAE